MHKCIVFTIAFGVLSTVAVSQEPTNYEELLERLEAIAKENTVWQSNVEMQMSLGPMEMSYGGTTKISGDKSRTEMEMEMGGQLSDIVTVSDGSGIQYTEMTRGGPLQVIKIDMNRLAEALGPEALDRASMGQGPSTPIDVTRSSREMLEDFSKGFDLDYMGTADHEDGKVYLVEGGRRLADSELTGMAAQMAEAGILVETLKVAIGAADGFPRTIQWLGNEGQTLLDITYTNLELNPEFPEGTFNYEPPEGVRVIDATSIVERQVKQRQQ